ncbi:MAG: tol-pal system protein YbgF [Immundisolibacteraceae bacterium]|nr:tol-pal system protein YbgF [Immundisolibacteraceae bacterium]
MLLSIAIPVSGEVGGISADRQFDIQRRLEVVSQVQQLQGDLRELRGALEDNHHTIEDLQRRQREYYLDLDRRLIDVESRPLAVAPLTNVIQSAASTDNVAASVGGDAPVAIAPPGEQQPLAGNGSPAELKILEQQGYQQAFDLLKAAKYDQAVVAFEQFLQLYPVGSYADNARYWIGESYYVTRSFAKALLQFNQLLEKHPESGKRAGTQLKIGYIYYEQGKWAEANQLLSAVIAENLSPTAVRLAENRIKKMREEGHL